jgi:hypothetical protein
MRAEASTIGGRSTAAEGFAADFHLNKTQIGLVFSAFAYPYLLFQIWGGWISA